MRSVFTSWKSKVQKEFKSYLKNMMSVVNTFGDNIMEQAPIANYSNFQGLPVFSKLIEEFLHSAMKVNPGDINLEILYVNK